MEVSNEIRELISHAFHEVYDHPLKQDQLDDLFDTASTPFVQLGDLGYSTEGIYEYIQAFLDSVKNSFYSPVGYNGEFDCFCHDEEKSGTQECYDCNTPLVEINNLFSKFSFLCNLHKIAESQSDSDEQLGKKRKRNSGQQKYTDLPKDTLEKITTKVLSIFSLHLKGMYDVVEQKEILQYISSRSESSWPDLMRLTNNTKNLLDAGLDRRTSAFNFCILVEIDSILAEVDEVKKMLDQKVYKTSKDNVQLVVTKVMIELFNHLVSQIEAGQTVDQEMGFKEELAANIIYFWNQYLSQIQYQGFDMITVILFLHQIKPWISKVEGLEQLCDELNQIFENSADAELFDLFLKQNDTSEKLSLNVVKANSASSETALSKFKKISSKKETESLLFIDLNPTPVPDVKFLDKFYLIEIQESRGIILHEKVDFEILEEAGIRRLCIIPKDLNDRCVCIMGSKLAVINNTQFEDLEYPFRSYVDDEFISTEIMKSFGKFSSFKFNQNKLCTISEPSKLSAILEICCKWNFVSSIRNLPGHIYGTLELVNQAKKKYMNNNKNKAYFTDMSEVFENNKYYKSFMEKSPLMNGLDTFSQKCDEHLRSFYEYDTNFGALFEKVHETASDVLKEVEECQHLIEHCKFLKETGFTQTYTSIEGQLHLKGLLNLVEIYHDMSLLNSFSTLSDVESIFVLPYKIDRQKYDFGDKVNEILSQSIYYYQLTLVSTPSAETEKVIADLKMIEKELKTNIDKMPENYESQRGQVKQLLIKLKEVYRDNLHNQSLSTLAQDIFSCLRNTKDIDMNESHHKLRSVTSIAISLYKAFYHDFGYLIGPFILTLIRLANDMASSLVICERLKDLNSSEKLHRKILNYPALYENPLSMLQYANSKIQIDSIIDSMHHQVQELVRLEVGERRDRDLKTAEKEELKGLFKIPITPQIEHLMKISKSIFDKTQKDKEREEEEERQEIAQNFPTYHEEFDKDRIFSKEEVQNADYEEPEDEPDIMSFNSFRNLSEKKKCFHKLLKTYKALLQKRDSILSKNSDIKTVSESAVLTEKFGEISKLFQTIFSRQSQDKIEESLTHTERKVMYLKIKQCFEALIKESKMSETKITLQVSRKDFPENYNFYEDPYFTEIKLVYAPMIKIIHRCLVLLEDWGDHPVLVDVVTYCNKILSFHCYRTPLQKVLTGLELVLQKLEEYSKIACKLNSVQDQINTCKLLIIRFRKIQIVSWKQMMHNDYDNFIHLTYALNTEVIKQEGIEYDKVFDAVDMYMRDSDLSQFNNRLLHLNILKSQMDSIGKKGVSNILHFVYMYYKQMETKHADVMKELQKETDEKIKTVVDVSKWSVQKFETSTVGRAYRQLNKCMNHYSRNVLDQDLTRTVIAKNREEIIGQYKTAATNVRGEFADLNKDPVSMVRKGDYAKIANPDLIKRLRHISKNQIFEKWNSHNFIEEKNIEIISKILDEWEKKVSSQRRDLNELFRFLKSQDISPNYKRIIEANRSSKYIDYEDVRFLYCHPSIRISDSMSYVMTRNEFYFYKNFELLLIFSSSFQKSDDIKNNEISYMRNFTGSLYYKLLTYSKNMNSVIDILRDNSISSTTGKFKHSIILEQLKNEPEDVSGLEYYKVLDLAQSKSILTRLTETLERINMILGINLQKDYNYYLQIRGCILTVEKAQEILENISNIKQNIDDDYQKLCSNYDEDIVVDLLNELSQLEIDLKTLCETSENIKDEKVFEAYEKYTKLLYQELTKIDKTDPEKAEKGQAEGVDKHVNELSYILETLSIYQKLSKYEKIIAQSGSIHLSILTMDTHILLIKTVERLLRYQKSLAKLLYILLTLFLNLTYNGFCGDRDQEEEEGEGEKGENFDVHDGTGMGEGKGMQNVSDEIEHEEQLEGLKDDQGDPDEQPDEKPEDNKEEDKAFDMKNDFEGTNEEKKEEEGKDKDDEVDSQQLDDEMDDVDNKLDNELFNEDNEISESEDEEAKDQDDSKPPMDLDKEVDLDHKDMEAKEIDHEQKNDINDQQDEEDKEQPQQEAEEDHEEPEDQDPDAEEEIQKEEGSDEDEEMSVEGEHKFDPTKEEDNNDGPEPDDDAQNDFDIDDLENMDGGSEEGKDEQMEDQAESEQLDEDNPDQDPDVDAEREQQPDEEDEAIASQVQNNKKQENNSMGNNMEKGQKQEDQEKDDNQANEEQKDYNTEDNDYLFQVMQQYLEKEKKEEQKKPKEGERNEDQNMKKAENVEEIEDLPEQAEGQDDQDDENAEDFAKDDKAKEKRSNVADTVKYNDEDMQPEDDQENEPEEAPAPEKDNEEMEDEEEKDKDLNEVKDEDPVKSMIQTNEFYQKYLDDKNKKKEEEKKQKEETEKTDQPDDPHENADHNDDAQMEDDSEEEEQIQLEKEEYKLDESSLDVLQLKKDMIQRYESWRKDKDQVSSSYELLNNFKKKTNHLSISLCEQMRIILEPTEKSRLRGDYKSGKRINIKKIIPFIASNYRNDKIWLRREMPFNRDYRVMIAIDDSLSMKNNNLGFFALESLVAISEALNQLNVGKVCLCGINDRLNMHMSFEDTYSAEKAAFTISNYSFEYKSHASADTSIPNFMQDCNKLLDSLHSSNKNIVFIISDGRFNKKKVLPYIMEAEEKNYLYMFILLDNYSIDSKNSVFNMKSAQFIKDDKGKGEYKITKYLEDFPFKYHTVVQEITHLPKVLANIFLQWLAVVNT
ncbi:unnamed protein product [Moneuplotes crassus]|uniref:VWFA domain-containing protein n=3 Tax=Euplotes crassus TaxID=5936 RepID=A0AAD1UCD7_EUPCR|nr:unnamed protein product [Moneuplotes crassus]